MGSGHNCELMQEEQILRLSMGALAIILLCLLSILILVLVFVVYNRRREAQIKYPNPDDDEGGGEDDMTAFDITPLQIPVADPSMVVGHHPSHHFHSLPRPQKGPSSNCKLFSRE